MALLDAGLEGEQVGVDEVALRDGGIKSWRVWVWPPSVVCSIELAA